MPDLDLHDDVKITDFPQSSAIKKSAFSQFMSRLFGFRRSPNKANNIEFVQTDLGSEDRIGQALLNNTTVFEKPLSQRLEKLYNYWLNENTDRYSDIIKRTERVNQIQYAFLNSPYINRTVALYADEATQLDDQDTLIQIETPDPRMTKDMYHLLNSWGITQNRLRATVEQLAMYGDAFWSNKITENGVIGIKPLKQLDILDRLEFNPAQVLEQKRRKEGGLSALAGRNYLMQKMLDAVDDSADQSVADLFDTKLFGFAIDNDTVVSPWNITHFRLGAESSEFFPFGTSPILGALAPFKQTQSAIALQSLAKMMSFPITLYKVKTSGQMDEAKQFAVVNKVREQYDNIGVNPALGGSEVYTVNTKIWVPDGLVDVDVKRPEVTNADNVDDVDVYQKREAVSLGLPVSFFTDWYGEGVASGKALIQQYKPFARKVFSLQSALLEGISDLFRIHFAITGIYDFRTPFSLSMRFPAEEVDEDKNTARKNSIDMADKVVGIVKAAIGAGDDEALPTEITRDILTKYTFLDPSDIMKWTRSSEYKMNIKKATGEDAEEALPDFEGLEDINEEPEEDIDLAVEESKKAVENRLRENTLKSNYFENRDAIYFETLKESAVDSFVRNDYHWQVYNQIPDSMSTLLEVLSQGSKTSRLKEAAPKKNRKKKTQTVIEEK